jgi:hypothetical protein
MQETEPASKTDHSSKNLALTLGRKFFANRLLFGLIIAFLAAFFIRIHLPWSDWPIWRVLSAVLVLLGLGIRALADGFGGATPEPKKSKRLGYLPEAPIASYATRSTLGVWSLGSEWLACWRAGSL